MATDINDKVLQIKSSALGLFSIQLDESNVTSSSQLMMFARYAN